MFTALRPFLRLPPEPTHTLVWYEKRWDAMQAMGPGEHITHGLFPHPLTQQHGVGSPEAVEAWGLWAEKVGRFYSPSELLTMLQVPQRESDEDFRLRISERLPEDVRCILLTMEDVELDKFGIRYRTVRFTYTPS